MANAIYTSIRSLTIDIQSNRYPGDMAGTLAPIRATISAGSSINSQVPALIISGMEGSNGAVASMAAAMPKITAAMGTAPAIAGKLGKITASISGWSSYPAAMASVLPRLQISGTAYTGNMATLAASLSSMGANLVAMAHPVGNLVARLRPIQIDAEALVGYPGSIDTILPNLVCRFTGYSGMGDDLEVALPTMEISGEILSTCSFDLRYTRGRVR